MEVKNNLELEQQTVADADSLELVQHRSTLFLFRPVSPAHTCVCIFVPMY